MGQQCGQTWLQTFSEVNALYNSGKQLPYLQLVTWNDYEEGTEIESGIGNCLAISASVSGNSLKWSIQGNEDTVDHYAPYISTDGQNLMPLSDSSPGTTSVNLCSYSFPNGVYTAYVQAVGKPSIANQMSGPAKFTLNCSQGVTNPGLIMNASPTDDRDPVGFERKTHGYSYASVGIVQQSGCTRLLRIAGIPQLCVRPFNGDPRQYFCYLSADHCCG